ncbi:MAG: DUF3604 domain-containing protein [Candidatus Eisenbacteria bacterium]
MKWGARAARLFLAGALVSPLAGCGTDDDSPGGNTGEPTAYGCIDGHAPLFDAYAVYWGDLHSHTVYSDDAAAQNPPPEDPAAALAWARDPAGGALDFAAITDHAETLTPEEWSSTLDAFHAADSAGFVVFAGFEYTNCSFDPGHGHKCAIFRDLAHLPAHPTGADSCADPTCLWQTLDADPGAAYYMTIPHHPSKGVDYGSNMATDWDASYVDHERQPLVEIYSVHGCSEASGCEEPVDHFQDDSTVEEALMKWLAAGDAGYKLGIVASTDNHLARPGSVEEIEETVATWEGEYTGGLVAVWAGALEREALWEGLQSKRVYGTSGGRIGLEFTAKAGATIVPMGGTLTFDDSTDVFLHVRATGEPGVGIREIQIIRNGELLVSDETDHLDYRDAGVTANAYYRVKVYQEATPVVRVTHCHFERAWSSPIWVERR